MRAIMISIKPEWVEKILNGEKTIEIRKTMPNIALPCKVYIYCTKDKNNILAGTLLVNGSWKCWNSKEWNNQQKKDVALGKYNGKVVAEFTLNKITIHEKNYIDVEDRLCYNFLSEDVKNAGFITSDFDEWQELQGLIDFDNFVENYGNGKPLYAWHINDLKIYDKPKELSLFKYSDCEFCKHIKFDAYYTDNRCCWAECKNILIKPPQSWCYVEEI